MFITGAIPLGYLLQAKTQCDEHHKIPLDLPGASTKYPEIFTKIKSFVSLGASEEDIPPIFVMVRSKKVSVSNMRPRGSKGNLIYMTDIIFDDIT